MTPELGIIIAQLLLKYGPDLTVKIVELFKKESVSLEDWLVMLNTAKKYEDYAPAIPTVTQPV